MKASIKALYRYPVKSMGGDNLDHTALTKNGIPGDRCWTVKDEERGGIKGGKRFPQLMDMHAVLEHEPDTLTLSPPVAITLPDQSHTHSTDPNVNQALSAAIGSPVSLWPLLSADQLEHYRRPPNPENFDQMAYFRALFARTDDEPLPDLSAFPEELSIYESSPGTYFDAFPLLIMTTASLNAMAAATAESNFDVRRFRPNILLDTDADGFVENSWVGKRLQLGSAILQINAICPRCVMTTHGFADLPKDPRVMRHLVRQNEGNLGVYASIEQSGNVKLGDQVEWLAPS
jgi:uncharacterized protein YcbX